MNGAEATGEAAMVHEWKGRTSVPANQTSPEVAEETKRHVREPPISVGAMLFQLVHVQPLARTPYVVAGRRKRAVLNL